MKTLSKLIIAALLVSAASANASESEITKNTVGCKDKQQLEKLQTYVNQKDQKALDIAVNKVMPTRQCTFFDVGEKIFITDSKMFSGVAKVRKYGETDEFWINFSTFKLGD